MELKVFFFQLLCAFLFKFGTGQRQRLRRPARVRVTSRSTDRAVLTWEQPPDVTYADFFLVVRPPNAVVEEVENPEVTRRAISNLRPGYRYIVSIFGITDDGQRSPPNNYELWSEPLPPANLTLETLQQIQLVVSFFGVENAFSSETVGIFADWSRSASTTSLSGYDVQISPRHGTETYPQPLLGQEFDLTSRIFVGLVPGEEYTLTVRAQTGPPYSLVYSSSLSQTIRIPPEVPFSAEASEAGTHHAFIQTIGPLRGIHDALYLELHPDHGQVNFPRPDPIRETHDLYHITGLTPGTTYQLRVYAVSQGVRSNDYIVTEFTTKPLPPSDVRIINLASESVTLRWTQTRQTEIDFIEYLIEIINEMNPEEETRTEIVRVEASNTTVYATIYQLTAGVTYRFVVYSVTRGERSEISRTIFQSTIPPIPRLEFFGGTQEGIMFRVVDPVVGKCPLVSVTYSPPLPGEKSGEPKIFETNTNITLPGVPQDERYSIHIVCVSENNIEGPPLVISSRAVVNANHGLLDELSLRRIPLACIKFRSNNASGSSTTLPIVRPIRPPAFGPRDFISPDGCCGFRPYRQLMRTCCGGVLHPNSPSNLCCGTRIYSPTTEVCCGNSVIAPNEVGCSE